MLNRHRFNNCDKIVRKASIATYPSFRVAVSELEWDVLTQPSTEHQLELPAGFTPGKTFGYYKLEWLSQAAKLVIIADRRRYSDLLSPEATRNCKLFPDGRSTHPVAEISTCADSKWSNVAAAEHLLGYDRKAKQKPKVTVNYCGESSNFRWDKHSISPWGRSCQRKRQ